MNSKPIVFYHEDCIDGFGAAYAAWTKLGEEAEYVPSSYKTEVHPEDFINLISDREVYILDFSFSKPVMELALTYASKVIWIDHHPGSIDLVKELRNFPTINPPDFVVSPSRSGAFWSWKYFNPEEEVPTLFKIIDDYDRWQLKDPDTKAIIAAVISYIPWSFKQWENRFLRLENSRDYYHLVDSGNAILRYQNFLAEEVVKTRRNHIVNCPLYLVNEVGFKIATLTGEYGLCYHIGGDNIVKCSLRSNGFDVSEIAKKYGGGGHKTAAAFYMPLKEFTENFLHERY